MEDFSLSAEYSGESILKLGVLGSGRHQAANNGLGLRQVVEGALAVSNLVPHSTQVRVRLRPFRFETRIVLTLLHELHVEWDRRFEQPLAQFVELCCLEFDTVAGLMQVL